MKEDGEVYGRDRPRQLLELLRVLAARIGELQREEDLEGAAADLLKLMGDARRELFQYEVRATFDSPGEAERRRIVDEARRQSENMDFGSNPDKWDDPEENGWT